MNLIEVAPIWVVAMLCAALIAAAVEDIVRLRVSNVTVIAVMATAAVAVALSAWSPALWENLMVFVLLLAGGTLLFAWEKVGGGDVKLFATVGLWMDFERALMLLAAVFISGGFIALFVLFPRLLMRRANGPALRDKSKSVPYAVAIAAGALLVIAVERQAAAERHANPLEFRPLAPAATQRG